MRFVKGNIPWSKGKHLSEETKLKLREGKLGEKNPNFGKHPSEITRKRLSHSRIGKHHSEETKHKISISQLGKHLSDEHKQKIRESHIGKVGWNKGLRGYTTSWKGGHHSQETKQKLRNDRLREKSPWWGRHHSEETKQKISEAHKRLYKNPEYVKKIMISANMRPNGLELYLDYLLQNHFPDEWQYVGDGQIIIDGLCPDFINVNGKRKIIEFFGEFWHGDDAPYRRTEEGRKKSFYDAGYSTLVIWGKDLVDEQAVVEKIKQFMM